MDLTLRIPDYHPTTGLVFEWEPETAITVGRSSNGTVVVRANRAGLVSLARHILTLAQETVPFGRHLHLDEFNGLESGSDELIFEVTESDEAN